MIRLASLVAAIALVVGCTGAPTASGSPSPTATVDIKKTKLNTAYAAMSDQDVHRASSKKILEAAIAALKAEATNTGGKAEFASIDFQDTVETVFPDFQKFADAAGDFARKNPQISPDRLADVAIQGMMSVSPDCHTYYVDKSGRGHQSRAQPSTGTGPQVPANGKLLGGPDQETGLLAKILDNGVVYITFNNFNSTGTYKLPDEVKKLLDKGLAASAKAWVFDLRGNSGGTPPDTMVSWFLNGEATLVAASRVGKPETKSAIQSLRLPQEYQLPIAIILNDRGGSSPEVFAASLKENKRATIVGSRSIGCLGATSISQMAEGGYIAVTVEEYSGAHTGTAYNNHGIEPDVPASDSDAVAKAIEAVTK